MLEEKKLDRQAWGDGPWVSEPDRAEWKDELTGYPCLAVRSSLGHWCGYVAVSPNHPAHGKGYDTVHEMSDQVAVHGGLTYASECRGHICHVPEAGEPDNVWWLGFDCAHCGDRSPGMKALFEDDVYRDLPYVRSECANLASQLKSLETNA